MEDREDNLTLTGDLMASPYQTNIQHSQSTSNQEDHHVLSIHHHGTTKILKIKKYTSVEDTKQNAFTLYQKNEFTNDNAILTYFDSNKVEVLLTSICELYEKRSGDFFIRFVCISSITDA